MFVDLDWPLNASSLLSASAELLVTRATLYVCCVACRAAATIGPRPGKCPERPGDLELSPLTLELDTILEFLRLFVVEL